MAKPLAADASHTSNPRRRCAARNAHTEGTETRQAASLDTMDATNTGDAVPLESVALVGKAVPRATRVGNGLTFDEVYEAEFAGFVRLAVLLVDHQSIAEELVQDAFVGASRRWASLDDPVRYVRQSVVNRCRSELRKRAVLRRKQRLIAAAESTTDVPERCSMPSAASTPGNAP
jgi:hypothetical protein